MPVKNPRDMFVLLLSELRQGSERTSKFFDEISQKAQDEDVKEALEARVFVSQKVLSTIDQCFKLIGEQPVKISGRLYDVLAEDFRKDLADNGGSIGPSPLHPCQRQPSDSLTDC